MFLFPFCFIEPRKACFAGKPFLGLSSRGDTNDRRGGIAPNLPRIFQFAELEKAADLHDHHLGVGGFTTVFCITPEADDAALRECRAPIYRHRKTHIHIVFIKNKYTPVGASDRYRPVTQLTPSTSCIKITYRVDTRGSDNYPIARRQIL